MTLIDNNEYLMYDFDAAIGGTWTAPDPPKLIFGRMPLTCIIHEFSKTPYPAREESRLGPAGGFCW